MGDKIEKVYIVGFAPSWQQTPWEDSGVTAEIWGINELYKLTSILGDKARFNRWFEIHEPKKDSKNSEEHQNFLKTCPIPLYMQKHYDEYPSSISFPREEVKALLKENMPFKNWSNQISWMIGFAILEGFKEIHVYGVDMATSETVIGPDGIEIKTGEYAWQRPSVDALLAFAASRGIKVHVPEESELLKFRGGLDYGWDTDNSTRLKFRADKKKYKTQLKSMSIEIHNRREIIKKANQDIFQLEHKISHIRGCIGYIDYVLGNNLV